MNARAAMRVVAVAFFTTLVVVVACSDQGPEPVASVSVSPSSATIRVGETLRLSATARDASGNSLAGRPITWSTSSAAVATVASSDLQGNQAVS